MSSRLPKKNFNLSDFFVGNRMTVREKEDFIPLFKTLEIDIKSKNDNNIAQLMSNQTSRFRDLCMLYMIAINDDEPFSYFMNIYTNYSDIHYDDDLFFCCAVNRKNYNKAIMLIDKGISAGTNDNFAINHITNQDSSDRYGDNDNIIFLQKLIDRGANVNADNGKPLGYAAKHNNFEYVELLIKNGADPIINNNAAIRKLCSARNRYLDDDTRSLEYLINAGADPNANNGEPLKSCIYNEHFVKVLLDHGATVDYLDPISLYKLITFANYNIVKLLQSHGVDFTIVNKFVLTVDTEYEKRLTDIEPLFELLGSTGVDFKLLSMNLMRTLLNGFA